MKIVLSWKCTKELNTKPQKSYNTLVVGNTEIYLTTLISIYMTRFNHNLKKNNKMCKIVASFLNKHKTGMYEYLSVYYETYQ